MQTYLSDRTRPYFVLLSDLAKAFERVNPHWVLRILQILNAPVWVMQYATYVLFGRSVRHRVGRFYRPPIPVHQGVDMGRAVSVLLFCVAMDPIYVVLNAIPGVLSVKGYMDDNATCGTDGRWLSTAQLAFTLATTAGFQALGHHCIGVWSAESAGTTQPLPDQSQIKQGGPSFSQALGSMPVGADVILGCATRRAHLASADVADFLDGQDRLRDIWAHLLDVECACKCKTHLLGSSNATSHDISVADAAPWGARILASSATMLGLPLHGHGQDLGPPRIAAAFAAKAHATSKDRLRVFKHLQLSVRERGMFCAFYLQSTYSYAYSVHWPSAKELTNHRRLLARALYPSRAWIDMNALPEVLRYLRIAPVLAPDCLVLKAVIGLASRLLAPNLLSWEAASAVLPQALGQVLGRLFYAFPRTREVWNSCPGSGQPAAAMKTHLAKYIGLIEEKRAIAFLTRRMATAAWKDRSDISFLTLLHSLPHKTVAPTVRQAVQKWAFDEESDTWFLIRRHWTRLSVCACGCGADSKLFPCGFFAGALSQAHLNLEIEWMRHVPIGAAALGVHTSSLPSLPVMLPSPPALRHDGHLDSATALLRQSAPWLQRACVLCGYGDNSVQPLGPSRRVVVCATPKRDGVPIWAR